MPERVIDALAKSAGPLTTAALAKALLPDREHWQAVHRVGQALRRLKAAGRVTGRPVPRRTRGKREQTWSLADGATSAGRTASAGRDHSDGALPQDDGLAPDTGCVSVTPATSADPTLMPRDFAPLARQMAMAQLAPLHPSTAPEAIAAEQRADVARFLAERPDATAEEIAAAVCLPVWSVERRLTELRGAAVVEPKPAPVDVAKKRRPNPPGERAKFNVGGSAA